MISAYVGLPGSGKSYGVWEYVISPALRTGREVWTNIPFDESICMAEFGLTPTLFDFEQINERETFFQTEVPKGVLFVIDECWRLWPSGLKATNAISGHKSFLAEHRHMVGENGKSTEIVLITQDLSQIANFARTLVEYTYRTSKLNAVGQSNRFRVDVYSGAVTGHSPPKARKLREMYGTYREEIYKLYSSHTMSETGAAGDETTVDERFNILKGSRFKIYGLVILLGLFFVWWASGRVFNHYTDEDAQNELPANFAPPEAFGLEPIAPMPKPRTYDIFNGLRPYISFNIGNYPNIDYSFTVDENGYTFTVKQAVLESLRL